MLHFAVRGGSPACIRLLAQAGASVHAAVPGLQQQPLHWAAAAASADCCAELLAAGACPAAVDGSGRSAVQLSHQRLQHELAAEQRAPFQRPAAGLSEARKVLALLQAAASGQLLGRGDATISVSGAAAAPDAAPPTPPLGSRAASLTSLDGTASTAGSSAGAGVGDGGGGGGGGGSSNAAALSSGVCAASGGSRPHEAATPATLPPAASHGRRECRVCLQEGGELLALIPCGHRATCATCTARLLLPGLMKRLAAAGNGAAPGSNAANSDCAGCHCPVCRAEVRRGTGMEWGRE